MNSQVDRTNRLRVDIGADADAGRKLPQFALPSSTSYPMGGIIDPIYQPKRSPVRLIDRKKDLVCLGKSAKPGVTTLTSKFLGQGGRTKLAGVSHPRRSLNALSSKEVADAAALSRRHRSPSKLSSSLQSVAPSTSAQATARRSQPISSHRDAQLAGPQTLMIKGDRTNLADDPFVLTHDYFSQAHGLCDKVYSTTHTAGKFLKGKDIKPLIKGAFSRS